MGKVFATVSGKGGVGKSSVTTGLGIAFAQKGNRVLLVDMDEGLRCLDLLLGVDKTAVFDLSDVLAGKSIEDAVYPCTYKEGLFLIPAPAKTGFIDNSALKDFAASVKSMFDIVIFDFPAGINEEQYSSLPEDTLFLTVAIPDPVSVRDAAAISEVLYSKQLEARLIINRFKYKLKRKLRFKNVDEIIDTATLRLIGIVPESDEIALFSLKKKLPKRSRAFKAFLRITDRLDGAGRLLPKAKKI